MKTLRIPWYLLFVLAATAPICAAETDEKSLLAVLASDADLHEKARACQQLNLVGGSESIPALAALLGHELHERLGIKEGDKVDLMSRQFRVHKCHPARGSKDDITAWIHLKDAQEILRLPLNILSKNSCLPSSTFAGGGEPLS